jgi:DNA-binding transcriptional regulator YiaG
MKIKTLREAAGMTQQAFADYFGIPKRSIENWEGEQRKCPVYLLTLMEYKLNAEKIIKTEE